MALGFRATSRVYPQAMKPVAVAIVAIVALYSQQPPSVLKPGDFISVGGPGLASCTFLPSAVVSGYCQPLRAAVTESGSLVIYKGDGSAVPSAQAGIGAEGDGEILFSSPVPRWRRFEVILEADGTRPREEA